MTDSSSRPSSAPRPKPNSNAASFASRIASGESAAAVLDAIPRAERAAALYEWAHWARDDQKAPKGDWTTWLLLGGRGAGKTRAGAEWVRARVANGAGRLALVAETYEDAREVMIEGESGLRATCPPWDRPRYEASRHRLVWPGGAEAHVFSAQDPEGLRGYQHDAAWSDELAKWPDADAVWSNLQLGLRLGERPRQVVTTTPRPSPLLRSLLAADTTIVTRASTYANQANLAPAFLTEIARAFEGTRLGRQELMGELLEDTVGALWSWDGIEACRSQSAPPLDRIVLAVDPPATSGPHADACGLIVAGRAGDTAYVLADASVQGLSPRGWAQRAVAAARAHEADRVVAEANQGGEMVEAVLRQEDEALPIRLVRATRGKTVRAEPVAALYERGRVRHVGAFPELETQLTGFTGAPGEGSPDRLDALVWALSDLMLRPAAAPTIRTL